MDPPVISEIQQLKGRIGADGHSEHSSLRVCIGREEGKRERLQQEGLQACELGNGSDLAIRRGPARNAEGQGNGVVGSALEDVSVGDEAAQDEVAPRTDQVAHLQTCPSRVLIHEDLDLRNGGTCSLAASDAEVVRVVEGASEDEVADG